MKKLLSVLAILCVILIVPALDDQLKTVGAEMPRLELNIKNTSKEVGQWIGIGILGIGLLLSARYSNL